MTLEVVGWTLAVLMGTGVMVIAGIAVVAIVASLIDCIQQKLLGEHND